MKKSVFTIGIFAMMIIFASCEKEVIEIVNDSNESSNYVTKDLSTDGNGTDIYDNVTDPDEDEDFDTDKKNKVGSGK